MYRTLTYPFDKWTWFGSIVCVIGVLVALYLLKYYYAGMGDLLSTYQALSISTVAMISESLPAHFFDSRKHSR